MSAAFSRYAHHAATAYDRTFMLNAADFRFKPNLHLGQCAANVWFG